MRGRISLFLPILRFRLDTEEPVSKSLCRFLIRLRLLRGRSKIRMVFRLNYRHCPVEKQSADGLLQPEKVCPLELFPHLVHPALPDGRLTAGCACGFPAAAALCNVVRMLRFSSSLILEDFFL